MEPIELLQPGDVIFGRFKVEAGGRGGGQCFGFKGEDIQAPANRPWERPVFIKQYHDVILGTGEAEALGAHFEALRERLREKSHYLCRPICVGEAKNSVIAVFEYVSGKSLRAWMEEGINQTQCTRFAQAITNAVRILHTAGIAHLDLKPDNVLIEENRRSGNLFVRLIDTDAARINGVGLRRKVYGTPGYMSPEHFAPKRYGEVSERSDVFTLGIMLFELLLKRYPFAGNDYRFAVENAAFEIPPNTYHREIIEQVVSCLQPDPSRRPRAGWIHSTLHKHHETDFAALDPKDRWVNGYVRIESGEFRRTYYQSVHLGRTNFRGSGVVGLPPTFLLLRINASDVSIELTDDDVNISLGDRPLVLGRPRRLNSGDTFVIDNNHFIVSVA